MYQRQVVRGRLLVARRDSAKSLQVVEEDLDEIALTVELSIESAPIVFARGVVANDRLHPLRTHRGDDAVCIVRRICEQHVPSSMRDELFGDGRIVLLPWRQGDVQWTRLSIDKGVGLR